MTNPLELTATALALLYLVLAIREQRSCFIAGGLSAALYLWIFWQVQLYLESGLQMFYMAMSVYGFMHWRTAQQRDLPISRWSAKAHLTAVIVILVLTLSLGLLLGNHTDAALPFADSFTTIAALITTWMVTQKLLENWIYWIVIDVVAAAMYVDRGLMLTAGLFALYTVLALVGFLQWRHHYQRQCAA